MAKFGMYTKGTNEGGHYINVIEVSSKEQATAYFAGVKRLSLSQFNNLFVVKEIGSLNENKNLLLG